MWLQLQLPLFLLPFLPITAAPAVVCQFSDTFSSITYTTWLLKSPLLCAQRTLGRFFHFMSHVISHDVGSRHTAGQADAAVLADFGCHSLHSILEPGVLQLATCDLQLATGDS